MKFMDPDNSNCEHWLISWMESPVAVVKGTEKQAEAHAREYVEDLIREFGKNDPTPEDIEFRVNEYITYRKMRVFEGDPT